MLSTSPVFEREFGDATLLGALYGEFAGALPEPLTLVPMLALDEALCSRITSLQKPHRFLAGQVTALVH